MSGQQSSSTGGAADHPDNPDESPDGEDIEAQRAIEESIQAANATENTTRRTESNLESSLIPATTSTNNADEHGIRPGTSVDEDVDDVDAEAQEAIERSIQEANSTSRTVSNLQSSVVQAITPIFDHAADHPIQPEVSHDEAVIQAQLAIERSLQSTGPNVTSAPTQESNSEVLSVGPDGMLEISGGPEVSPAQRATLAHPPIATTTTTTLELPDTARTLLSEPIIPATPRNLDPIVAHDPNAPEPGEEAQLRAVLTAMLGQLSPAPAPVDPFAIAPPGSRLRRNRQNRFCRRCWGERTNVQRKGKTGTKGRRYNGHGVYVPVRQPRPFAPPEPRVVQRQTRREPRIARRQPQRRRQRRRRNPASRRR